MEYLHLFANCKLVKGASMSLICDLQLRKYYHIPNDMAEVLEYLADHSIAETYEAFGIDNKGIIQSYIKFVIKQDMGFLDNKIWTEMTPLSLTWDAFTEITNVIFEIKAGMNYRVPFIEDLLALHLQAVEIRSYEIIPQEQLKELLAMFKYSTVLSIKLILHDNPAVSEKVWQHIMEDDFRINTILLHSAKENRQVKLMRDTATIIYSQSKLDSCLQCGVIQPSYFSTSIELFSESQLHNTCLNRKLAIDQEGHIKNCPSMTMNYGHFHSTSLASILSNAEFRKDWYINKDQIVVCQDCEFRHICTDCRAYTERTHIDSSGRDTSKPLKCGYDPYSSQWEDWTQNPLKEEAISYYQMEDVIKQTSNG